MNKPLKTQWGETWFYNKKDLEWLAMGNVPKKNSEGYLIMPYGNAHGYKVYPELFKGQS